MTIHEESLTIPIFIDEYLLIARLHAESLIRPTFLSDHWSKPILKDDELVFMTIPALLALPSVLNKCNELSPYF